MSQNSDFKFHEFEVKFRVDESKLNDWKEIVRKHKEESNNYKHFIYVDSDDVYYTKKTVSADLDYEFIRYRFSEEESRAELTTKKKLKDSNNIIRMEYNVRVDNNDYETIEKFITDGLDYEYNFSITKYVSIYVFEDVTLPFYTVIDENGKRDTFIEIEINEDIIHNLTEKEAWDTIKKYEKLFEPLGITAKNRLRLSLFEMYRK